MEIGKQKAETRDTKQSSFHFPFSGFQLRSGRWLITTVAAAMAVAWSAEAYAQGCPLCANTVSAAKASALLALRNGILILIVPPLVICAGILWLGIKARNRFNEPAGQRESSDQELAQMLAQIEPEEGGSR